MRVMAAQGYEGFGREGDLSRQTDGTLKLRLNRATWQGHPFKWSFAAYVAGHRYIVARP